MRKETRPHTQDKKKQHAKEKNRYACS